ncbi:hypothetical protein AVKW3434_07690 [Acidovorax sp. SUPP3434]|nr:hypothetical protein AVKW3434_07690 [Acidovorax sp. SUPP3434]
MTTIVAVSTNAKYGAIHQFGGKIDQPERATIVRYRSVAGTVLFAGKKHKTATVRALAIPAHKVKMPARLYLGLSAADDAEIREIIREWVMERSLERLV